MSNPSSSLFDYEVYDSTGDKVGSVENVWTDDKGKAEYLGVSTGWLGLGQTHVVPVRNAVVDHAARTVKVSFTEQTIKASPSYAFSDSLSDDEESRLRTHYGFDLGNDGGTATADAPASSTVRSGLSPKEVSGAEETIEVPLAEEKVHVSKREVSLGEVRLRKVVRTEVVNQPVELRREEVVVERVSGGALKPGEEPFAEKVISIPLTEEEAVVRKTVESAGAVKATKIAESEESNVSETVRREDVEVERDTPGTRS